MRITPILDTRITRKSGLYPIYVRIADAGKTKYVKTGFQIKEAYWAENAVKKTHPQANIINAKIADIMASISRTAADAELNNRPFFIELAGTSKMTHSFIEHIFNSGMEYEKSQMPVMVIKCRMLVRELKEVFPDLYFDQLTPETVKKIDQHFIAKKNSPNTRHRKMKFFGQFFETAKKKGLTNGVNVFREYEIKRIPVVKEKLTVEEIERLEKLELTGHLDMARDIFLFSFYSKGQRFSDCLFFERKSIRDGRVHFITEKVNKPVSVKIHDRLQGIIDKYPKGKYLFGYLKKEPKDAYEKLRITGMFNALVNKYLKTVAKKAGITKKLSMHIARHSFASQLMSVTDSIHVIKEALAHSNYRTTEIYLKSLDTNYLDSEMEKLYGK